MRRCQRRMWVGSSMTALVLSVFLVGCPKRPEVTETAPKAIGPQGAIAMPAPPPPPTVSGAAPTVPAPGAQQSPAEVTAQAEDAKTAPDAPIEEVEAPSAERTETMSPDGAASPPQPSEMGVTREASIKEGEVSPKAEEEKAGVGAQTRAPAEGSEVLPELPAPVKEADATLGTEGQVKGGEITAPAPAELSTEGTSSAAPSEPVATTPVAPAPVAPPPAPAPEPAVVAEAPKPPELTVKDIFFDFDQSVIREDSRKTLADNIQWLRANAAAKVTIEGHCDERGSSEYNLALGERRGRVTRDYLVAAGINASRITTISYGKERPFVLGHDESAWKWNRRAHFVVSPK